MSEPLNPVNCTHKHYLKEWIDGVLYARCDNCGAVHRVTEGEWPKSWAVAGDEDE